MAKINGDDGRLFAVVSGDDRMPVFVKEGYVGFWPCGPDKYYGWAVLHSNQLYDQGSSANPLNPRGLLFTTINGQTELLAANADPEIDVITPASFKATAAPEIDANTASAALTLLFGGLAVLVGRRRRHAGAPQNV